MLRESVVPSLANATIAVFAAVVTSRGARTWQRRNSARLFWGLAGYGLAGAVGYAFPGDAAKYWFLLCMYFALLGGAHLLVSARALAAGTNELTDSPPRFAGITVGLSAIVGLPLLVAPALGVGPHDATLHQALLGMLIAILFAASIGFYGLAMRRKRRGARAYLFAALLPLTPLFMDIVSNLGVRTLTYHIERDLAILAFVYFLVGAQLDHGSEPTRLSDRLLLATLTAVLAVVIVTTKLYTVQSAAMAGDAAVAAQAIHRATAGMLLVWALAVLLVFTAFPRLYRRNTIQPLESLIRGVERIERGERNVQIAASSADELGQLTHAFNSMADAVSASERQLAENLQTLTDKNREVEELNQELRRQVAQRSREIAEVAERTAAQSGQLNVGELIASRYRIESLLGSGAMGLVFAARRVTDDKRFALKTMTANSQEGTIRFAREAEIAAQLDHPNLVSVVDVGVFRGTAYLVMELVDGGSLEDCRERFSSVEFALAILPGIAAALVVLHERGVVHRDLKPANVLLAERAGERLVKVSDFGIARQQGIDVFGNTAAVGPGGNLTATGAIMGTLPYMAPELSQGSERAAPASDIYAFGLISYELLTTHLPYEIPPLFLALSGQPLPPPPPLPAVVPEWLAALVYRCLDPNPAARPSAAELVESLERTDLKT